MASTTQTSLWQLTVRVAGHDLRSSFECGEDTVLLSRLTALRVALRGVVATARRSNIAGAVTIAEHACFILLSVSPSIFVTEVYYFLRVKVNKE